MRTREFRVLYSMADNSIDVGYSLPSLYAYSRDDKKTQTRWVLVYPTLMRLILGSLIGYGLGFGINIDNPIELR